MRDTLSAAEARARTALRSAPSTRALACQRFTRVAGGLSNHAWRVGDGRASWFVRLGRAEAMPGADLATECRVLAAVVAAGLAPAVLRCDADRRLLVTRWVDGGVHRRARLRATDLRSIAEALCVLHGLRAPAGVRRIDFGAQARELEGVVGASPAALRLRAQSREVFARQRSGASAAVLCHNDLNALNLIWQRPARLWLVDWEYAGRGDPAFDLASFASQHRLDARQRLQLLRAYGDGGGAVTHARLELAVWAFDYVQWLWYRAAHVRPGSGVARRIAQARAARLEIALRRRASRVLRCNNAAFGD